MFRAIRERRAEKRREQFEEELRLVEKAKAADDSKEVIRLYKRIIKKDPENRDAWLNLGIAHGMEETYPKAMEAFDKVLGMDPKDDEGWFFKGLTTLEMGDPETALELIEKSIMLGSSRPQSAYAQHAGALMDLNRFREAAESLEMALGVNQKHSGLWSLLINCYQRSNQPDKAWEAIDRALEVYPFEPEILQMRARQLSNDGNWEEASAEFGKLMRMNPEHPTALMEKALADLSLEDKEAALAGLDEYVKEHPDNPDLLMLYGSLLMDAGRVEEAIDVMDHGLANKPIMPEFAWGGYAFLTLLHHYIQLSERPTLARMCWQKALSCREHLKPEKWDDLIEEHLTRLIFDDQVEEAAQVILECGHGQEKFSPAAVVVHQALYPDDESYKKLSPEQRVRVARLIIDQFQAPEDSGLEEDDQVVL